MSLDALAPDQRAVVQLVLQQDRSYDDLAGLLGITTEAVRERAHRGLERLSPADGVDPGERAEVSDYLLGQQSVSGREATRTLLSGSPATRDWALAVAGSLAPIARSPLPEIPSGAAAEPAAPAREPEPTPTAEEPVVRARPRRRAPESEGAEPAADEPVTRARPRRRSAAVEADLAAAGTTAAATPAVATPEPASDPAPASADRGERKPRSSFAGIALLGGGLAILVIALVVFLAGGGDDDEPETASNGATPTATAEAGATPDYRQIGGLELTAADGSSATGQMAVYVAAAEGTEAEASVLFQVVGENLEPTTNGSAYGIWLTGGDEPHFLGFAPKVGENGELGTRGPRPEDAANFLTWLSEARNFVISRETTDKAKAPTDIVLTGNIRETSDANPDATPVPSP